MKLSACSPHTRDGWTGPVIADPTQGSAGAKAKAQSSRKSARRREATEELIEASLKPMHLRLPPLRLSCSSAINCASCLSRNCQGVTMVVGMLRGAGLGLAHVQECKAM